uniref:Turripeptide OL55 n=1 Tax=Iotyrris olangoensis TaxID=2420066 RepID=TU55_IOTOL|nr:RecName: Full=Turripeptide OL55 [Iotyrris olangoensis]
QACSETSDCLEGLECSGNQCLIPYDGDDSCVTGFDCVIGVGCVYDNGNPGRCIRDHRCKGDKKDICTNPATECDEDKVCGYKEGETCYGPCRKGLTCRNTRCQK